MICGRHNSLLHFKNLSEFDNLSHFTSTIVGGVSEGSYATFNLGMYSEDDIDCVAENRERLARILNIPEEDIIVPHQTHDDKVLIIDDTFLRKTDLEKVQMLNGVDALITNQRNICIGITTADCVPVLIYDSEKSILAAVHAGWKGTVSKIVGKTVIKMIEALGCTPDDLYIGIGPCISQQHFEVGDEVVDAFDRADFLLDDISYRNKETGKAHIDLQKANKLTLIETGISEKNIEEATLCTFANSDKFFSARRQTIHSGRMLTGGVIR
ncbi:MAG: peptidoglycan editing factor PgeF [Dysgonomonas sp.]